MSSIEEVRAALMLAIEKAEQTSAAITHSRLEVDQIDALLQTAGGGSSNDAYVQGSMAFLKAHQALGELQQLVRSGMDNLAEYAQQL